MVGKSKLVRIAIITVILFSLAVGLVAAQYTTEQTTNVTVGSDGTFTATQSDVGVSYQITGTPGSTGTVTADVYNGNPQATASVPSGVSLSSFIALTFNMNANDFTGAIITINYTDAQVQNINSPYTVYKYIASNDSYVELPSTVDTNAKTITVTLNSVTDPLLAIGGATKTTNGGGSNNTWLFVTVSVVLIVVAVVVIVMMMRPKNKPKYPTYNKDDDSSPPKTKSLTRSQDDDLPPPKTKYPSYNQDDDLLSPPPKSKYPSYNQGDDLLSSPPKTKYPSYNQDDDLLSPPKKRRAR